MENDPSSSGKKAMRYEEKHPKIEYKPKPESPAKKSVMYRLKTTDEQTAAPQQEPPNRNKSQEQEYQRPKFVEKKENCGEYMDLISVVAHVGAHVNLKVMICVNKRNENENGY